jgi:hypothetical protein
MKSLLSLFILTGALLQSGCSPNAATPPNPTPQPQPSQAQSSPGPRNQGGQASAGAVQNVRQAAKRVGDGNDLRNFAQAYTYYALENGGRGPASVQDIRGSLTPKMVNAFGNDGDYEVKWGIQNPSSNSIVAYAKDADVYGTRLVAKGDGTVVRMSKEEFEQAKSGR